MDLIRLMPNRVFGTQNFGRIFSAKNPREMQVALLVSFEPRAAR